MKTTTGRQHRTAFSKKRTRINSGEDVAITRRRKTVGRRPPADGAPRKRSAVPDFTSRLRRVYGDKVVSAGAMAEILAENKGRC
jgi:antitoxin (DNA-binding transcriptional repressor) of toxin-antitoxin stability system